MASHHSGSEDIELVVIDTPDLSLFMKGKPYHHRYNSLRAYQKREDLGEETMYFSVTGAEAGRVDVYDVRSGEHAALSSSTHHGLAPIFFENGVYQIVIEPKHDQSLSFEHEDPRLKQAVSSVHMRDNALLMGNLQFTNEIGFSTFSIWHDKEKLLEVTLEIFPTKLDYKHDYQQLLADVNQEVYNLAFHFIKKTYLHASRVGSKNPSWTEFYRLLEEHFQQFMKAIRRIESQPHHVLQTTYQQVRGDQLRRLDRRGRHYLTKRPQLFQQVSQGININGQSMMPTKGLQAKKDMTFDTLENRFVKWMMMRLNDKIAALYDKLSQRRFPGEQYDQEASLEKLWHMRQMLSRRLKAPFWRHLSRPDRSVVSLVIQRKSGYREAYQIYLILSRGLTLQGQLYKMSVKDVATLYEYWTFIKLGQILSKHYEPVSQNIVKTTHHGLFVDLDQSKSASRVFRHPQTQEKIKLKFQNKNKNLPTATQIPDTTLMLEKKDRDFAYQFIFDAKYRIDFAAEGTSYKTSHGTPGPLEEDINTMHRYRDALVANAHGPYERTAFGAYVLFPGFNEAEYVTHDFYKSIGDVNIGGFPFLPNTTGLVEQFLQHLIEKSPEQIYEEGILPRGVKEEWASYVVEKVLVGLEKSYNRFKAHWKDHFYHIPEKSLREGWQEADYVALYLPQKGFPEEVNGIYAFGKIKDVYMKRRSDIESLPSNNPEPYVIIEVEGWQRLETVIPPVDYGIQSYMMTTLQNLQQAKELPELFMKTREDISLWQLLRRFSEKARIHLDASYVDRAENIKNYDIKWLRLNLDHDTGYFRISDKRDGQVKETLPLYWLNQQRTSVFKKVSALLSE